MHRKRYPLLMLVLTALACGLATPTPPAESAAALPQGETGASEKRCGDGACDGPENAQNCPQDCSESSAHGGEISPPAIDAAGEYWVTNPATGAQLYVIVTTPAGGQGPYPALVIVPGGIGYASSPDENDNLADVLAGEGIVVVAFDPDGRGRSDGIEDYDGYAQQDGLAAVIEFAAALPQVDPARLGVASFSYGITMASGALARHPDLPVSFLMDWEGPADRFDTTVGCSANTHIDFAPCDDADFWAQREALNFIPDVQVPYQRLQSEKDHVQPDVEHAINMVNAAVQGEPPWVRLNDLPPDQTYDPANPPAMLSEKETRSLEQLTLQYALEMFSLHGASSPSAAPAPSSGEISIPPVYLTVAVHIEDVPAYANCDAYPDFRRKLLDFAEAIAPYSLAVNLQIEYEFLMGVSRCESDALKATTDGLNVLDYLVAHYGYEIDPHQEGGWDIEGQDNYADIRYLGGQLTTVSETMGGLVWDDPDQWARLAAGEDGQITPGFTWKPEMLTLAVSSRHHLGDFSDDDVASGVWIPKGAGDDFWVHDPEGPFIYIGPGEHDDWSAHPTDLSTPEYVQSLLDQMEAGVIPADAMYTVTLAVPQGIVFHPEDHARLLAVLDELAPFVERGQAVYVTYSQAAEIWREEYNAVPNIFRR